MTSGEWDPAPNQDGFGESISSDDVSSEAVSGDDVSIDDVLVVDEVVAPEVTPSSTVHSIPCMRSPTPM